MIPLSLLERRRLSPLARMVWIRLLAHRNRRDSQCNPTHSRLAEELEVSVHKIRRAMLELWRARLISGTNKCGRGNWYTLHEPDAFPQPVETVENAGNSASPQQENAQAAYAPVRRLPMHLCAGMASVSLYELDVFNQKEGTSDAAVSSEGLRKPAEAAAAAAALPASPKTSEHERPAAPQDVPDVITQQQPLIQHQQQPLILDQPGLMGEPSVINITPVSKPQPVLEPAGSSGEPPSALAKGSADQPVTIGADCGPRTLPDSDIPAIAEALVEELHAEHPQPGLPDKAIPLVEAILTAAEDIEATVERIRANHAAWKLHWEIKRPGQFIPQLWRWFRDGEWKRTVGKPIRQETWYQRQDRVQQEFKATEDILKPLYDAEMEDWRARRRYA
jgi:hypothetical protein